ncbi:pro-FMRFamide-related neuropeptide VF isoform X2 [Gadus macrocephalus]|nr:pro-FMRFamide-related neuropeptide VF isoform X2 [Gadus macrocephalus]
MSLEMSRTVLFLGVLALASAGGAAAAEQVLYGKPVRSEKTFLIEGRYSGRKRPSLKAIGEMRRSMDLGALDLEPMSSTNGKSSFPTMVQLYPPTTEKVYQPIAEPVHLKAKLPLRFGRQSEPSIERSLKSTPNLPQRFGRACAECPDVDNALWPASTPQYWLSVINRPYYRYHFRRPGFG